MRQRVRFWAVFVSAVIFAVCLTGCGKKGPPMVPAADRRVMPAPAELTVRCNDAGQAVLNWTFDAGQLPESIDLTGFDIFMSQQTAEDCRGCPVVFHKSGSVPAGHRQYVIQVQNGFRYQFKVTATGEPDLNSAFSNVAELRQP